MIAFRITEVPGLAFDLWVADGRGGAVALKDGVIYTFTKAQIQRALAAVMHEKEVSEVGKT